ncbi:MAG: hypothetical protein IJV28_04110 [Paludibacteraceae bacterium]|nr:hypothetical protein [Paludibacteraceae bacterium]
MKKIMIFVAATLIMAGCGFMKNSTGSNQNSAVSSQSTTTTTAQSGNTAVSAGQGAGNALLALYNQYKADGNKYDYKNMQNILNTVTLVANCEGLKDNFKDKTYLKEFGKGMIASSLGLVTQNNVETVTNSLVDMVKNSETVQNATTQAQSTASTAAGYANTAAQYAGALSTLLGAFSGK